MPVLHGIVTTTDGALQTIRIGVTRADAGRRRHAGQVIPPAIEVSALIDTGAEVTCIDPAVVARLGLLPKDLSMTNAPDVDALGFHWLYDVDLTISDAATYRPRHLQVPSLEVVELPLNARGCEAVLGRDVLASCVLIYDGTAGSFTLTY